MDDGRNYPDVGSGNQAQCSSIVKIGEYNCICTDSEMFEGASWDGIVQVELKTNRVIDHFERAALCSASYTLDCQLEGCL